MQFGDQIRPAAGGGCRFEPVAIGGDGLGQPAAGLMLPPGGKVLLCG